MHPNLFPRHFICFLFERGSVSVLCVCKEQSWTQDVVSLVWNLESEGCSRPGSVQRSKPHLPNIKMTLCSFRKRFMLELLLCEHFRLSLSFPGLLLLCQNQHLYSPTKFIARNPTHQHVLELKSQLVSFRAASRFLSGSPGRKL